MLACATTVLLLAGGARAADAPTSQTATSRLQLSANAKPSTLSLVAVAADGSGRQIDYSIGSSAKVESMNPKWQEARDVVFRSTLDGSEQRYVELLPENFDETAEHDLLIALHGLFSDRWQFAREERGECAGARLVAYAHGMVYVSPDYRATGSWMNAEAEADLVQIAAEQKAKHRIRHVFLMGASMGGVSALIFTALHPGLVAGVCSENATTNMVEYKNYPETVVKAYGGTPDEKPDEYRKRSPEFVPEKFTMPIAFTASGKDTAVPPQNVLRFAESVKKTNPNVLVLYREEVGHETSLADTVEAIEFVVRAATGAK